MEIYLVGGAVRDFLLAKLNGQLLTTQEEQDYWTRVEKDWVVVGSTPSEMLELGFRQVGKSFPVFLHPDTQEEYALARTERKTGKGYTSFDCYAQPDVTLEEDLKRRDLTINAIAMKVNLTDFTSQEIIDPYAGVQDLKAKKFRHISEAFAEDPVRILRVARLCARFSEFEIDTKTLELMNSMVQMGEVDALVPERVWQEWLRALKEESPWRFFETLELCQVKDKLFPEIKNLSFKKIVLTKAVGINSSEIIRFALLVFDLDQNTIKKLCLNYHIPNEFRDLSLIVAKFYAHYLNILQLDPENILSFLEKSDAFRRQDRFFDFIQACEILDTENNRQKLIRSELIKKIFTKILSIDNNLIAKQGFQGAAFAQELRRIRLDIIKHTLGIFPSQPNDRSRT